MNFAIIGATGNVGRTTIKVLEKSKIEIDNLFLVASEKSAGQKLVFRKKEIIVEQLEKYDFSKSEITIFAAGSDIAKNWAPKASKKTIVIDNSKYFRMDKDVPLVVAEVNPNDLRTHKNIIANPIATILSLSMALRYSLDLEKEANLSDSAVQKVLDEGLRTKDIISAGKKEVTTTDMGDAIISKLK